VFHTTYTHTHISLNTTHNHDPRSHEKQMHMTRLINPRHDTILTHIYTYIYVCAWLTCAAARSTARSTVLRVAAHELVGAFSIPVPFVIMSIEQAACVRACVCVSLSLFLCTQQNTLHCTYILFLSDVVFS